MYAVAEREVLGGRTRDEEAVWVVEAPWIPVGGGHMQRDDGPFRDCRTRDLGLFGHLTKRELDRRRQPVRLLQEMGPRDQILRNPQTEYNQRLVAAVPVPDPEEQRRRPAADAGLFD